MGDDRSSEWFTLRRFTAGVALLVAIGFPEVIFGGHTFAFRDFSVFGYPLAHHAREGFWRGEVPLWNPLNMGGVPFLAQWNTMALYPPTLFHLLLPLDWALAVFNLGHLVAAGAAMFALARRWTGSGFAAAVAGLAFAFNGVTLNALQWPNNIAALAWMPLVVLLAGDAVREGGRRLVLAALAGAMQMLTGAPEVIVFTWIIVCEPERTSQVRSLGRLALLVAWVAALAAAQLIPFLDLPAHSQRGAGFGGATWPMPPWGWANFLVPLFFTHDFGYGAPFQYGQLWVTSYYLCLGVVVLAAVGMAWSRDSRRWPLAVLTALALVLALGEAGRLWTLLWQVLPGAGFMRFPVKFVLIVGFCVPLLSALAVAAWEQDVRTPEDRCRRQLWLAGVACLALIGGVLWFARHHPQYAPPFDHFPETFRNGLTRAGFLAATLAALALALKHGATRHGNLLRGGVLLVLWLDAWTHAPLPVTTVPRDTYATSAEVLRQMPTHGATRALVSREALNVLFEHAASRHAYTNLVLNRLALNCNLNLLDATPKVNGFFALNLRAAEDIQSLFYGTSPSAPGPLLDFLGVSHVTAAGELFKWDQRRTALPLVTAGQRARFADAGTILAYMGTERFKPAEELLFEPELQALIQVTNTTTASVTGVQTSAHRIEFTANAAAPSLVSLAQTHHRFWRATVDGEPVPLWRANHAFQALAVPAGEHRVVVRYVDVGFRLGCVILLAALAICVWCWRMNRTGT